MVAAAVSTHSPSGGQAANLAVDALVEANTERPPIDFGIVSATLIHFRSEICQRAGLACQRLTRSEIRCDIL